MHLRTIDCYFKTLAQVIRGVEVTDELGQVISLDRAFAQVGQSAHASHDAGYKIIFVGNGGSAGIASHLAIDFSKNGGLRAQAFNDACALTCLGNDLGYENVFAKQIEFHGRSGDLLIAISSSGNSPNIIAGVKSARKCGMQVVTYSGFGEDNSLRRAGDVNFYVKSREYGFVEVAHLSLCHALLDIDMGWSEFKLDRTAVLAE
jgi:D-sedoheptulose 7-phosphate isomerase